jgi:hypothetical protein
LYLLVFQTVAWIGFSVCQPRQQGGAYRKAAPLSFADEVLLPAAPAGAESTKVLCKFVAARHRQPAATEAVGRRLDAHVPTLQGPAGFTSGRRDYLIWSAFPPRASVGHCPLLLLTSRAAFLSLGSRQFARLTWRRVPSIFLANIGISTRMLRWRTTSTSRCSGRA